MNNNPDKIKITINIQKIKKSYFSTCEVSMDNKKNFNGSSRGISYQKAYQSLNYQIEDIINQFWTPPIVLSLIISAES